MTSLVQEDLKYIYDSLSVKERDSFFGASFLLTGCAGFLGFYLMQFLVHYKKELNIEHIIGLDNFISGTPAWLKRLDGSDSITLKTFDIGKDDIHTVGGAEKATHVFHMASIASPVYYRQYPLETLDANVLGLRKLLDFYRVKRLKSLCFFSSSEIYGNPPPDWIPTPETYPGNVNCQGPRACYDESKRFGETLCYLYAQNFDLPIRIIRPFNNYGPGMRLNDGRVVADFASAVNSGRDMIIYSDGTPTRTFCYIADAVTGYLKVMAYEKYDTFNIGIDKPEMSVRELAEIFREAGRQLNGYNGQIIFKISEDKEYMEHCPLRRCPDITRARELLQYAPSILPEQGVKRFLQFIKQSNSKELTW